MKKFIIRYKWLILALVVGVFLRTIAIDSVPRSLYGDELTMVYDTYSLIHTGRDQLGNFLPITFKMGAGRPAGYVYGSIPFVYLFGLGVWGVRLLSILSGVGLIILLYLIGRKLFSESVGLIVAWLVVFSPWMISLSRGGFEANFALFLAVLGVWFGLNLDKKWSILGWVVSWCLAVNTYPTYKLTLPIFGVILAYFIGIKKIFNYNSKIVLSISIVVLIVTAVVVVQQFVFGNSESRFLDINIFSDRTISNQIMERVNFDRDRDDLPKIFQPIFNNKYWEYGKLIADSYFANLSWNFLFLSGDGNPRHNPGEAGGLYLIESLSVFWGILILWQKKRGIFYLIIAWVLVSPVGTAMLGVPHFLRSSFMVVPLILVSGLGVNELLENRKRYSIYFKYLFSAIYVVSVGLFLIYLFTISANKTEEFWSYSARLASHEVMLNQGKFDYVIVSDRIDDVEFAYPVYAKIDPNIIISQNRNRTILNGLVFKQIGNVYIGKIPDGWQEAFFNGLSGKVLFIGSMYDDRFVFQAEHLVDRKGKELVVIKRIK